MSYGGAKRERTQRTATKQVNLVEGDGVFLSTQRHRLSAFRQLRKGQSMTTHDAAEKIKLRNHVRTEYRGLAGRTAVLCMMFPNERLEPFLDQWMHDVRPLSVVQFAAEVATKTIRRVIDAEALRLELQRYPKEVLELLSGNGLEKIVNEPHTFSIDEDAFEKGLDFHWERLAELSTKHGIKFKSRRLGHGFGPHLPEKQTGAWLNEIQEFGAPGTEYFRVARIAVEKEGRLLTAEQLEAAKLNARIHKDPIGARKEEAMLKETIEKLSAKVKADKSTILPDNHPAQELQILETSVILVMAVVEAHKTYLNEQFSGWLHQSIQAALKRRGLSEHTEWPSRGWEGERESLATQLDEQRKGLLQEHDAKVSSLQASHDAQLAEQQRQFEERLNDEKVRWAKEMRRRQREKAKKQAESVPDTDTTDDDEFPADGTPQERTVQKRRLEAVREVLKDYGNLTPSAITPRRHDHLVARLDRALATVNRKSAIKKTVDGFRDWLAKVDIRESLKDRYRRDSVLFEDTYPPAQFRWLLGRHLRYRLELEEFRENATTLNGMLDDFEQKAGHLREEKELQREMREQDERIAAHGRRLKLDQETIEDQKFFARRKARREAQQRSVTSPPALPPSQVLSDGSTER